MIRLKDILSEAFPRNLKQLEKYLIQKSNMGTISDEDAKTIYHLYSGQVNAGRMNMKRAIQGALKDIAAQASKTEAGDPLRQSYKGTAAKDYGTNQAQNRTNFRPGAPNPRSQQAKAPKAKPIKEAEGDIVGDSARKRIYDETASLHKILDLVSKRTGRRPRPGQTFMDLDGAFEVLNALWKVEIGAQHLANFVDKLIENYKREHKG